MTTEQKQIALDIIANSNSPKISINVPVTDNYSVAHAILIHEGNAALISELVHKGFSLFMTNKGLSITYF